MKELLYLILAIVALKYWKISLAIVALVLLLRIIGVIHRAISPAANRAYIERQAREAEKKKIIQEEQAKQAAAERAAAERREAYLRNEAERKELERCRHRDADKQDTPYTYEIGKHGNAALALRYGIVNQERKIKEYWYYESGGGRARNSDRDKVFYEESKTINIQKTKKVGSDMYEVILPDFKNRKAKAIIEAGTEYVKTFYPLDEKGWFQKHADLETVLKDNGAFTLKELAKFHIDKTVGI